MKNKQRDSLQDIQDMYPGLFKQVGKPGASIELDNDYPEEYAQILVIHDTRSLIRKFVDFIRDTVKR